MKAVLTTHQHWDHIRALPEFDVAGVELLANERDAGEIEAQQGVAVDRLLTHGETVTFDGITLEVIHLRGHTPGSLAFALNVEDGPTHLFTGIRSFPAAWARRGRMRTSCS